MGPIGDTFWKRYHNRETRDSSEDKRAVQRTTDQLHADYHYLEDRLEKLTLICRALWELRPEKPELTDDDLMAKVAEIDLRDGELNHRLTPPVLTCPECGRRVNARSRRCIYCGFDDFKLGVFESV
jgi:hypothetical protein